VTQAKAVVIPGDRDGRVVRRAVLQPEPDLGPSVMTGGDVRVRLQDDAVVHQRDWRNAVTLMSGGRLGDLHGRLEQVWRAVFAG
jgi:hypothetical protein